MRDMSPGERRAFLAEGTRTGKLAVTMADGTPHVTPIWFVLDGDDVLFTTWHTSVKARAMRRDPRVSLCVDLEEPPYAYVHLRGRVTFDEDLDAVRRAATEIGSRYMGADRAEEFGRRNGVPGEHLVRLVADHVVAEHDMAG
ncbi:MAG: PPOX class F420-dependent oxidoreductase [Acidimicrobiia bacterium]|nr:PPOX class F420-dependent oxidoreductase [Acidimicrobiia bacterium]